MILCFYLRYTVLEEFEAVFTNLQFLDLVIKS
jgi:hypothetical protein